MVQPCSKHRATGTDRVAHGQQSTIHVHAVWFKPQGLSVEQGLGCERLHELNAIGLTMLCPQMVEPISQGSRRQARCERIASHLAGRKHLAHRDSSRMEGMR